MHTALRKLALRNAAKVALGPLAFGCGGSLVLPDAATESGAADAHASADALVDIAPALDAALACTGPVEVDASTIDTPTFECCLGVEQGIVGDAAPWEVDAGAVTGDPSSVNCCKAIIAHVDLVTADYSAASPVLPMCCTALQYPMGPACTPWGPPTPPSMDWVAEVA